MFSIFDSGLNRREFLRIGSLALGGLSLPGLPESIHPAIRLNEPTGPFSYGYVVKNYIPAGKLGAGYDAFLASGGSQLMSNLRLQLPRQQFDDRRQLLGQIDSFQRQLDKTR